MTKSFQSAVKYGVANVLPQLSGFLLLPLYSHYLTAEGYGEIAKIEMVNFFVSIFILFSLDKSVQVFYFEQETQKKKNVLLDSLLVTVILLGALISIFISVFLKGLDIGFASDYSVYIVSACYFNAVVNINLSILHIKSQVNQYVATILFRTVVQVVLIYFFLATLDLSVQGYLYATCIAPFLVYIPIVISKAKKRVKIDKFIILSSLKYSSAFIPMMLVTWVNNMSDRALIDYFIGNEEVGLYAMSYRMSSVLLVFSSALSLVFIPYFYKLANQLGNRSKIAFTLEKNIYLMILMFLSISLFIDDVINIVLSEIYSDIYIYVLILLNSMLLSALMSISTVLFLLKEKLTKDNLVACFYSALSSISFNFFLIPFVGLIGAAISNLVSKIVLFGAQYNRSKKGYFVVLPWWRFGLTVVICNLLSFIVISLDLSLIMEVFIKLSVILVGALLFLTKYYAKELSNRLTGV